MLHIILNHHTPRQHYVGAAVQSIAFEQVTLLSVRLAPYQLAGRGRGGFEARGWGRDGGRGRGFAHPLAHVQQQQPGDKRPADAAADGDAKRARLEEGADEESAEGSLAMLQGYGDDGSGDEGGGGAGDAVQAGDQAGDGGFGDAGQSAGAAASIVRLMCKRCHPAGSCTASALDELNWLPVCWGLSQPKHPDQA